MTVSKVIDYFTQCLENGLLVSIAYQGAEGMAQRLRKAGELSVGEYCACLDLITRLKTYMELEGLR